VSLSSLASLGNLRAQAQQRSDLEASQHITTAEWNQYISQSYKRLYDKLVAAYGSNYYVQTPYQFTISGQTLYSLPSDFYKLLGVDLQYSASPTGWVTLKRLEFIDRNKYNWLQPLPITASLVQLWYIPEPTPLQFCETTQCTNSSAVVTVNDVSDLSVGMNAYQNAAQTCIVTGSTIVSINAAANQVTLSNPCSSTGVNIPVYFWSDAATLDGISGWEEFVVIDAAIKAGIKEESEISDLRIQKAEMLKDIEDMAEARDIGQAHHVSDVLSVNTPIVSIGATNLKYHILGNQILFVPAGFDDYSDGYGTFGGLGGM
jgi:hypothetical protein